MPQLQRIVVAPQQIQGQQIRLNPEQIHYLLRVLRLKVGDRFVAMDGQGHSWLATLIETAASTPIRAEVLDSLVSHTELPVMTTLVMALPRGTGFDEVVRQVTELGVSTIAPVISDRTLLHPGPQKLERWRRIAQEAAEQSERQIVPTILEPTPLVKYLKASHTPALKYICITRQSAPHLLTCLHPLPRSPHPIQIAIGPEGGWTAGEIEQAIAAGYQPVSLGSRILRAVTAPIVALSLVAALYETGNDRVVEN